MALRWIALLVSAALAAGCAAQRAPDTTAMGAGPACDLRIDIGSDHRCAVQHVAPTQDEQLITNSTRIQQPQALPPVR